MPTNVAALTTLTAIGGKVLEQQGKVRDSLVKASEAKAFLDKYLKGNSLISASKPARFEPITIMDSTLAAKEYTSDLLSFATDVFSASLMQAVGLITAKVNGVNVIKTLDTLNPARQMSNLIHYTNSNESHNERAFLPKFIGEPALERFNDPYTPSMESKGTRGDEKAIQASGVTSDSLKDIRESASNSVGKLLEITLGDSKVKVTIPVSVRLMVRLADYDVIPMIFAPGRKRTMIENFHAWRSGEDKFWRDIVFAKKALTERRKMNLNDVDGIRMEIDKRIRESKLMTSLTNEPSLGELSNILIVNASTARQLEVQLRGKLDNYDLREKLFENTGMMMILVVDEHHDQVEVYYHSIAGKSQRALSDFKRKSRGNSGPDIATMMQALNSLSAPSF